MNAYLPLLRLTHYCSLLRVCVVSLQQQTTVTRHENYNFFSAWTQNDMKTQKRCIFTWVPVWNLLRPSASPAAEALIDFYSAGLLTCLFPKIEDCCSMTLCFSTSLNHKNGGFSHWSWRIRAVFTRRWQTFFNHLIYKFYQDSMSTPIL